jgi:glycogen debranching enzyme
MCTVANFTPPQRGNSTPPLSPLALRHLRRLTNGLADPPTADLPINDGESRPELRRFFARDALRASFALADMIPALSLTTVVRLAQMQGVTYNAAREEEPGRIPHEIRDPDRDPAARALSERRGWGWGWPYYGAVDITPLFVLLLLRLCKRAGRPVMDTIYCGRDGELHTLGEAHRAALGPWENEVIARGLRRFGHHEQADNLERRGLDSCRENRHVPRVRPRRGRSHRGQTAVIDVDDPDVAIDRAGQSPQQIQTWTVAAVLGIEQRRRELNIAAAA